MISLADFKARWEAIDNRVRANRARYMPSPVEHSACEDDRNMLCRELVLCLADQKPADLCDWPRIAELIEAAQVVSQSVRGHANGHAEKRN